MVVGCAACYVLGTIWFMVLTGADLVSAMGWCVLPYLPGDAVKIVLAAVLTIQLDKRLKGSLVYPQKYLAAFSAALALFRAAFLCYNKKTGKL